MVSVAWDEEHTTLINNSIAEGNRLKEAPKPEGIARANSRCLRKC
jgi:hypothetical protein